MAVHVHGRGPGHLCRKTNAVSIPATGIFFNTDTGDTFTGTKITVPSDASLTTAANSITFLQTGSDKNLNAQLNDSTGSQIHSAFTDITFEATYTVRPFDVVSAKGVCLGFAPNENVGGLFGGAIHSHGGAANEAIGWSVLNGANLDNDGGGDVLTGGKVITSKVEFLGDSFRHTITYPGAGQKIINETMTFAASSFQMQVMFSALGLNFARGDLTLTRLKGYASYPNAKFCVVGDSIDQGRKASNFASGWAALLRGDYASNVLIAAAPGSATSDWKTKLQHVLDMKPKYCLVKLGTNDLSLNRALAAIEADYTVILNTLVAGGVTPITLAVPPKGDVLVPTLNTWIAGRGYLFIDIYTPLLGTGTSMNALYNTANPNGTGGAGDGIHPNDAGHAVIHTTVAAALAGL